MNEWMKGWMNEGSFFLQSSRENYRVNLSIQNQAFFFFFKGKVTSFSFCVFIVALFVLLWNKTRSHLLGSPSNQTSAGMRPLLCLCYEPTGSSLINSLILSWGKKLCFKSSCQEAITFCSALAHHKNHSKWLLQVLPKLPMFIDLATLENISWKIIFS